MFNLIEKAYAVTGGQLNIGFDLIDTSDLIGLIATGLNILLFLAGAIAVIFLVYGGVLYITAGGDAEKATKGRTALINAIVGIVIILISLAIVNFIHQEFARPE